MYYAVAEDPDEEGMTRCDRRAKSPSRNRYAFAQVEIDYRAPDVSAKGMGRFTPTTSEGADGAPRAIRPYVALSACAVRIPEVILVLVGSGGEGGCIISI